MEPPQYSTDSNDPSPTSILLEITTLNDNISFSTSDACIEGEVQIKSIEAPSANVRRNALGGGGREPVRFDRLELCFRGIESREGADSIELFMVNRILWGVGVRPSTSASPFSDVPPSSTPFTLPLTSDSPGCIHLPHSSLQYTLCATLSNTTDPSITPIIKIVPVHLSRSSPSDSFSSTPVHLSISDPLPVSVRLSRTTYSRSEPINLLVKVEVPNAELIRRRGLRLRTISAELWKVVVVGMDRVIAERENDREDEIQEIEPLRSELESQQEMISRSGKSCRLSRTRPIVIRLRLHPPISGPCESVTQVRHRLVLQLIASICSLESRN